jgi:hypothetical protein
LSAGTVLIGGSVAQRPGIGGHTWVFLQYLLGLRELGWEPVLVDRLEPEMCIGPDGGPSPAEQSENMRYLGLVLERFGLERSYAVLVDGGSRCLGMSRGELNERAGRAALLLNVNGFVGDADVLERVALRAYLDIDPGFAQMWRALGLHDAFAGHDAFVTIGERVGSPDCDVPTCGLDWITTPQPVVLSHWPVSTAPSRAFTSVASWRGTDAPIEYRGKTYGLRVHEFRKFAALPRRSPERFELALDIHPAEKPDLELLHENGWALVDPAAAAGDPWRYRDFVQGSKAELMVAKNMYVRSRSGWLSDRSLCYLASGRPVLAQDTGFTAVHPAGEGLVPFTTLDEAVAGADAIAGDLERHGRAARALAEERFASNVVLPRLLERLGVR